MRVHAEEPLEHSAHRLADRGRERLAHSHLTKPVRSVKRWEVRSGVGRRMQGWRETVRRVEALTLTLTLTLTMAHREDGLVVERGLHPREHIVHVLGRATPDRLFDALAVGPLVLKLGAGRHRGTAHLWLGLGG